MKVRAIDRDDSTEWLRMRNALWPGDGHAEEIEAWFAGPNPAAEVFVVEREDGSLAGFLELDTRPYAEGCPSSPVPFIEGWYVDPDVRRKGFGAALVRAAETWARDHGFTEIASDVLLDNVDSQAAHKALGYEEVERIVCFRRELT